MSLTLISLRGIPREFNTDALALQRLCCFFETSENQIFCLVHTNFLKLHQAPVSRVYPNLPRTAAQSCRLEDANGSALQIDHCLHSSIRRPRNRRTAKGIDHLVNIASSFCQYIPLLRKVFQISTSRNASTAHDKTKHSSLKNSYHLSTVADHPQVSDHPEIRTSPLAQSPQHQHSNLLKYLDHVAILHFRLSFYRPTHSLVHPSTLQDHHTW